MSIIEEAEPATDEPRIQANVDEDKLKDEEKFQLGLEKNYKELQEEVERKQKDDPNYLFVDQDFLPDDKALVYSGWPEPGTVWKRPHDISPNPKMCVDGFSKNDIMQGSLGDCYFLIAAAAVAGEPKLLRKLVPAGQSLSKQDTRSSYNGLLHFRFWRYGNWVDIALDDCLPTLQGFLLIYGHSADSNEFWVALLEKAYAKLNGSYQALNGGHNAETLEDFTGGLAIPYNLEHIDRDQLYKKIAKAIRHDSFVGASLFGSGDKRKEIEAKGLVANHAYTVTGATVVKLLSTGDSFKLVRMRNPWGNSKEWTGRFSDGSAIWKDVSESTKKALQLKIQADGEFWMSMDDLYEYFWGVTICTLGPDFDENGIIYAGRWLLSSVRGKWVTGVNAGGSRNNETFYTNPQYLLQVISADDAEIGEESEVEEEVSGSYVQIGLMQEHRRVDKSTVLPNYGIGMTIFKLKDKPSKKLDNRALIRTPVAAQNTSFLQMREAHLTATLEPGFYVIVPATFKPNSSSSFYMRIFTEKEVGLTELT